MINVANNDDVSVVRHIPALVPVAGVLYGHDFQIVHPADDWHTVRVGLQGDRVHLLVKLGLRLIIGAQAALFHDHPDFLREFLGVEVQMPHTIRLELHHLFQLLLGHLLKVGGVVLARKSVVTPPRSGHQSVELTGANAWRTLEHHVFQQVRHARRPVGFVHAAGAVPDHMHNRRRAAVFLDDDTQAVVEQLFEGGSLRGRGCGKRQQQGAEAGDSSCIAHGGG